MKPVIQYQAADGDMFDSIEACLKHETLVNRVKLAMQPLGPEPRLTIRQCYQHSRADCEDAKNAVLALVREQYAGSDIAVLKLPNEKIGVLSYLGRMLDDNGGPLNTAWHRLMRINWDNYREYEQPYFALHPDEATELINQPEPSVPEPAVKNRAVDL